MIVQSELLQRYRESYGQAGCPVDKVCVLGTCLLVPHFSQVIFGIPMSTFMQLFSFVSSNVCAPVRGVVTQWEISA